MAASARSKISPRWAPTLRGGRGRQHTILPNFPKNCMKLKEFGSRGGRPKFHYVDPPLAALYMSCMYEPCIDFVPNTCKRVSYYKLQDWKLIFLYISSSTAKESCESARRVQLIVLITSKSVWVPVLEILWWMVRNCAVITCETFFYEGDCDLMVNIGGIYGLLYRKKFWVMYNLIVMLHIAV